MCGIAGILNLKSPAGIPAEAVASMIEAQIHRGPDEQGVYLDDWAALGHARLSIIDLSTGTQPLSNEDGSLWITYNGEIFNYPELHDDLVRKGHCFNTSSDTEVIVHLYEEYGTDCLRHMNGQFAFAIWDARNLQLFLARDRVGILPLHYCFHNDRFLFASEAKGLFSSSLGPEAELAPQAIEQVFTFWSPLGSHTAFREIQKLEPGHFMLIGPEVNRIERYWSLPFPTTDQKPAISFDEAAETVRELLLDSIRIRLRADVPVGAYLSGGLDSSIVTALAKTRFSNHLKTFGIRFSNALFDEGVFQEKMIEHLGVDHDSITARDENIGNAMEDVVWHCEVPMTRTAPAPLYLLSGLVQRNNFKVVLTGEGSDEFFAGYNIFKEAKIRRSWSRNPESRLWPLLLRKIYPYVFRDKRLYPFLRTFYARGLDQPDHPFFSHMIRWENGKRLTSFFAPEFAAQLSDDASRGTVLRSLPPEFDSMDIVARAQFLEASIFMSGYLLSCQADRVAMAHGVEIRVPFLDHRLLEFLGTLPSSWKLKVLQEKYLLKRAFHDILPDEIVNRPKHPYRAPIQKSLLEGHARDVTLNAFSPSSIRDTGYFDEGKVAVLLAKMQQQKQATEVDEMALVGILTTQLLHRQFKMLKCGRAARLQFQRVIDRRGSALRQAFQPA